MNAGGARAVHERHNCALYNVTSIFTVIPKRRQPWLLGQLPWRLGESFSARPLGMICNKSWAEHESSGTQRTLLLLTFNLAHNRFYLRQV